MNDTVPGAGRGPSVLAASLWGRCPRCGKGNLFRGYLTLSPSCPACGLDFAGFEAGDGPAVFVILIVGAIVAGGMLFFNSGYGGFGRPAGNVLLAFGRAD